MNKTIYNTAFRILSTQEDMCQRLENIGLRFEYGEGYVGETLLKLLNDSELIIKEALGLHSVSEPCTCNISGIDYPITLDILYTSEDDPDWSITEDDFCEFFYQAQHNEEVRDLMWKAMIEKDETAKNKFNELDCGRIGVTYSKTEKEQ